MAGHSCQGRSGIFWSSRWGSGVADRSSDLGWRRAADLDWDITDRVRSSELESELVSSSLPDPSQKSRTEAEKKKNRRNALVWPIWKVSWRILRGSTIIGGCLLGLRKNHWTVISVEHADAWLAEQAISVESYGYVLPSSRRQKQGSIPPE